MPLRPAPRPMGGRSKPARRADRARPVPEPEPREATRALVAAAAAIRERAYAPYSRFKVGAAVQASSGQIYPGCNVENCSYGLALCAERGAVAAAVAAGETALCAVAVVTGSDEPSPPCGMCLQTLAEFAPPSLRVVLVNLRGQTTLFSLGELMPHAFARSYL